jgi:N-formylglutamate deformylase
VSLPHVGTELPADQRGRYRPRAIEVEDTDWHLERLYGFVRERARVAAGAHATAAT